MSGAARVARAPFHAAWLLMRTVGHAIDAAFFLAAITVWCALHVALWSYAFEIGPAADCFALPCPDGLRSKVLLGCVALFVASFIAALAMRRLRHRATSLVLLLLVTFDLAALLLLAISSI